MMLRPLIRPIVRPLVRGVTAPGYGSRFKGLFTRRFDGGTLLPYGTTAINEAVATGTTSRTLSVDTTVTFRGEPSTKCVIVGSGSNTTLEIGVNSASLSFDADAQDMVDRRMVVAIKTDGANTPNNLILYVGDGSYSNFRTYNFQYSAGYYDEVDGWRLYERAQLGASSTTGTPIALTEPHRGKLRISMAANVAPGTVWLAFCKVIPKPRPCVVFTCDDGYDEWVWLASEAKARGVPVSFGVSSDLIDTAGFLTEAQMLAIGNDESGLFEITNHLTTNSNYTTLGLAPYANAADTCRTYLTGLGLDEYAASLHSYIQGDSDAALWAEMASRGYHSGRHAGGNGVGSLSANIALGATGRSIMNVWASASLDVAYNLAAVQSAITSAVDGGTAFIMGHRFEAAAGSITWINGYDANYGVLNLLDWLAEKRDTEGWRLMRWSDWHRAMTTGANVI